MNMPDIADRLRDYSCFERKRTGTCSCAKKNDCLYSRMLITQINLGEASKEQLAKFLYKKTCGQSKSNRSCGHFHCISNEKMIQWLSE